MPVIDADSCPIHVEIEGREQGPVLMLSNSLGADLHMWDDQAPAFAKEFRLVRYDRRGHGKSGVPRGPYSMERLGRDVLAILDALKIKKAHWCGLSMGGMVGQWLGANAPERIEKLVLCNNTCHYADKGPWNDRLKLLREKGTVNVLLAGTMERWFTKGFRDSHQQTIARLSAIFLATKLEGYIACGEAVRDMDHRALLPKIKAPTLIIAGQHDNACTVAMSEYLRDHIPGAKLVVFESAHISNIEQPEIFTKTVLDFLRG